MGFEADAPKTTAVTSKDLDWARAMKAPSGKLFGEITPDQLTLIMEHKAATAEQKKAAAHAHRFQDHRQSVLGEGNDGRKISQGAANRNPG